MILWKLSSDIEGQLVFLFLLYPKRREKIFNVLEEHQNSLKGIGKELLDYLKTLKELDDFSESDFASFLSKRNFEYFLEISNYRFEVIRNVPDISEEMADKDIKLLENYLKYPQIKKWIEEVFLALKETQEKPQKRNLFRLLQELNALYRRL